MGGPWREHGFDPRALRAPRPRLPARAEALRRAADTDGLKRVVLAYIAAVVTSFGIALSLMLSGW